MAGMPVSTAVSKAASPAVAQPLRHDVQISPGARDIMQRAGLGLQERSYPTAEAALNARSGQWSGVHHQLPSTIVVRAPSLARRPVCAQHSRWLAIRELTNTDLPLLIPLPPTHRHSPPPRYAESRAVSPPTSRRAASSRRGSRSSWAARTPHWRGLKALSRPKEASGSGRTSRI
jgi:hypothetical protein